MTETEMQNRDEVSLLILATTLLQHRRRIAICILVGGVLMALLSFSRPALFVASASFVPMGTDPGRSSLAGLAGQLGVSLPVGNQAFSSDFYVKLLSSRVTLLPIVRDTFVVLEQHGERASFLNLFGVEGTTEAAREEEGIRLLTRTLKTSVDRTTGIVEFSLATRWSGVSKAIATALVNGVEDYNHLMRQGQAGAERKFVESRMAVAGVDLREAEQRMEYFLKANRQFGSSPELTFQHDRIQRDVTAKQQVFVMLTQSYEEARIREVRDTPAIMIIESPWVPPLPASRGRLARVLLGLVFGGFAGVLLAFVSDTMTRRGQEGDAEIHDLVGTLGEVQGEILGPVRWVKDRIRR